MFYVVLFTSFFTKKFLTVSFFSFNLKRTQYSANSESRYEFPSIKVLCTEECNFSLHNGSSRPKVRQKCDTRMNANHVIKDEGFLSSSLTVWGGVTSNYRARLVLLAISVTANSYVNRVLG